MTERQKFLRLLSFVIEDLPTSAVDTAVRAGYPAPTSMLANVRIARVMNLEHLVALIGYGLPNYSIPEDLLPAAPAPVGAPLALGL
ncbi:hypothetical protein J0X19_22015 [Hymenobacter sp. BT186]|uniref:Uncharacterized protein n=1 Tax=Hymenobacter telluris TaxID=2816474 RepID=A0A939F1J1_9BACT|nr:hypothetical protein [Hymenobacter telluris]MBO0360652.1 hypothetical protein [Hymenobacter telluris]MBW3376679.1 hypothetical protein [Hymenobacter norwichensis]